MKFLMSRVCRQFYLMLFLFLPVILTSCMSVKKAAALDSDGFVRLFDGKTLDGWVGDTAYWSVEGGCLTGIVTPANLLKRNTFIIWQGKMPEDFEIKVEYKISAEGNSGINYRSEELAGVPYALKGYQADLDGANNYTGSNYEERKRTTLASRGQQVVLPALEDVGDSLKGHIKNNQWIPAVVIASLGNRDSLNTHIKKDDWNEYHIKVKGNRLQHYLNGVLMSDVTDNDTVNRRFNGLLGVQVHVGPPMRVAYRNFRLKKI
jgi:hypothetical protein